MKRLAYIMGTFPAFTETFVLGEIEALEAAGAEADLYAFRRPGDASALAQGRGAELAARTCYSPGLASRELWGANLAAFRRAPGRYLGTLARVIAHTALNPVHCLKSLGIFPVAVAFAERMRERGIRHVHAHWATYPATAAYIVSRLLEIPFSFTAHVYDATLIRSFIPEKVRRARFVVTCNRFTQERLGRLVPDAADKVIVNYHGATLERFVPGERPDAGPVPRILSCGSLYPRKGFPVLLDACARLRDRGVAFELTIVGEGPMRPRLERQIRRLGLERHVTLAGALPQHEVVRHYRAADLFVLACVTDYLGWDDITSDPILLLEVGPAIPFRQLTDGIPNVLVEAMAMELPVVSTRVAGVPELVRDGDNGLLAPEGDPDALADAIERLLCDPALRRRLGRRGRETVLRHFDRSRNIRDLIGIFATRTALPVAVRAGADSAHAVVGS